MIRYVKGDIFETGCQTLVNPVNTVGVMGAGLAREFAKRYPEMLGPYRALCQSGIGIMPGVPWLYKGTSKWIYNFPTKVHWRDPSKLEYIEAGLATLARTWEARGITSIAIPKLGCGLGGLSWDDVRSLMEKHLGETEMDIEIYAE